MPRKILALLLLLMSFSASCLAQFYPTQYRPPSQHWQYLQTPHFKIVFPADADTSALQMGQLLEQQYGKVQNLVGGSLSNFPVILNGYNDRSNGFVTPLHFRSEIELPPIKGKYLNPRTGNWLENVAPHELVHAMQFSNLSDYNLPRLVSLFSPDMARTFHSAIPLGVLEGIAVQHETESVAPGGGRGNYPFFTNQFDAVFKSNSRWSMGQQVQISSRTRPFGRHYIGGYEFTAWMHEEYGPETTRDALDFYMDFPFLGYGVALRHATGLWPGQLYNRFEDQHQRQLREKNESAGQAATIPIPLDGREIRRPKWLSDSKLIFYGSFYNARAGFYSYDLANNDLKRLITTNTVGDYRYALSRDQSELVYSYYESSPIYDNTAKTELVRYEFSSGKSRQLTQNGRLYAPFFSGDSLLSLQTRPASSQLVSVTPGASPPITKILSLGDDEIKAVAANPRTHQLAVIVNKRGIQGLWITDRSNLKSDLQGAPDIVFNSGSVFDPQWHPAGNKLLFSSDFSGTYQLYEYDLENSSVTRLTDEAFNAFEGSYSPDGNRIAFVRQVKNERLPAVMNRTDFLNKQLDPTVWQPAPSQNKKMQHPMVPDSIVDQSAGWETGDYTSGLGWLKPRTVAPFFEEISNRDVYQLGLALHSNNLLANQSYSADVSYLEDRGWYDLAYRNTSFYPGFKLRLFSQPSYLSYVAQESGPAGTLLRESQNLALSVPLRVRLNQNIYSSSFFIEPEIRRARTRLFDLQNMDNVSDFASSTVGNIYAQFNYRLQQNIRDLQPNTGIILYSEVEHYLTSDELIFPVTNGNNLQLSLKDATALRGGIYAYLSPLRRWNQSLRLGLHGLTQSDFVFDNQSLVSDAFTEPVLSQSNNMVSFDARYTIPLTFVDNGGFLVPLYLSDLYLVAFSNTVTDPTLSDWQEATRSVFGLGIRAQFRVSNLAFDLGIGYGFEPSRNNHEFFVGDF